jgi:hypothetical protein
VPDRRSPARPAVVFRPGNTTVDDDHDGLTITYSWRSRERRWLVALGGGGLLGISLISSLMLLWSGTITLTAAAIIAILALDVLVVLAYFLLTASTVVRVTREAIQVRHRRHLLPQHFRIAVANLDQLFCVRVHAHVGAARMYRFHVAVLDRSGRRVILVPNLESRTEALYLERTIERHLGIADRPVRGELGKEAPTLARRDLRKGYLPSWRWGVLMTTFMAKSPFHRIKLNREDEAMYVRMQRQDRPRTRRRSPRGGKSNRAATPDRDEEDDARS